MDGFPSGQRGQTVNLLQIASVVRIHLHPFHAGVAELADAQDLKSCGGDIVPVRFRSPASKKVSRILIKGFGAFLFYLIFDIISEKLPNRIPDRWNHLCRNDADRNVFGIHSVSFRFVF